MATVDVALETSVLQPLLCLLVSCLDTYTNARQGWPSVRHGQNTALGTKQARNHTHTHTNTNTHSRTHKHAHARARTHTHTHARTHTSSWRPLALSFSFSFMACFIRSNAFSPIGLFLSSSRDFLCCACALPFSCAFDCSKVLHVCTKCARQRRVLTLSIPPSHLST